MSSNRFVESGRVIIERDTLEPARGGFIYIYLANTTTPLTTYSDAALTVQNAHPIVIDAQGFAPLIYVPYTDYRFVITSSSGALIIDEPVVKNTLPASSGGGGSVPDEQLFITGDLKPYPFPNANPRLGYVRANGQTIGNAVSGATERANADTYNLYSLYWGGFTQPPSNIYAGFVNGGRGASAASDFAANKTITLLDFKGRGFIGSDAMGATAAGRIQTITTLTSVLSSTSVTVASASNLAIGMYLTCVNFPFGTRITVINGTTITLSLAATAGGSGVAAKFSFFENAEEGGRFGGTALNVLSPLEMPAHNHGGQTTGASAALAEKRPTFTEITFSTAAPQFNLSVATGEADRTPDNDTRTHAIANQGGGLPFSNLHPSVTCTVYQKL